MYSNEKLSRGGDRKSSDYKSNGKSYRLISTEENQALEESNGKSCRLISVEGNQETAKKIAQQCGVSERTIRNDAKYAKAIDKICYNFGQEWRPIIIDSKLTRNQVKELADYVENEEYYVEIEAVLNDLEHGDDFQENYRIFTKKINPPLFRVCWITDKL